MLNPVNFAIGRIPEPFLFNKASAARRAGILQGTSVQGHAEDRLGRCHRRGDRQALAGRRPRHGPSRRVHGRKDDGLRHAEVRAPLAIRPRVRPRPQGGRRHVLRRAGPAGRQPGRPGQGEDADGGEEEAAGSSSEGRRHAARLRGGAQGEGGEGALGWGRAERAEGGPGQHWRPDHVRPRQVVAGCRAGLAGRTLEHACSVEFGRGPGRRHRGHSRRRREGQGHEPAGGRGRARPALSWGGPLLRHYSPGRRVPVFVQRKTSLHSFFLPFV